MRVGTKTTFQNLVILNRDTCHSGKDKIVFISSMSLKSQSESKGRGQCHQTNGKTEEGPKTLQESLMWTH